ncbi:MobF family relaxase [Enterovibrio paralichthyis]|uniref:MobF family relaxase n=1 Tax=Enterovibrio paralichthyis TaxID=2853805 RepID=UPI001C464B9F|nr:MobF family relaxase [Enterovibrio paralichthyis]MBV7300285.1 conjugative relaxase [Enterovibrio paralichthyis]
MMSINSIGSSGAASSYYEVDDYYNESNREGHEKLSEWHGKGAVLQGLSGPVKGEDFTRVLDGRAPDGTQLGRVVDGEIKHRPGIDLTFSPPKSVAIMAQVFGDTRIIEAHKAAVKETLDLVERVAAETRISQAGVKVRENTGNMTIATFFHTSTRAQDPGMHTHAVIANMTMTDSGQWRSIANENIWADSKARFGEHYSMLLANKLSNELGYNIVSRGQNAEYEIAGVPDHLIQEFSTRSRAIKDLLEERNLHGPKNKEWAALQTRDKKVPMDKALETEVWKERAANIGVDLSKLVDESIAIKANGITDVSELKALEAVQSAAEGLAQRESSFSRKELVQEARNYCVGYALDKDIAAAVKVLEKNEFLIAPNQAERGMLTTRETVAFENDNLLRMELGRNSFGPFLPSERTAEIAKTFTLNNSQADTLLKVSNSNDRYVGNQGWAGVGKTHWAKAAKVVFEEAGYKTVGLSASAQAAKELQTQSGIDSNTLASFIGQYRDRLDVTQGERLKQETIADIRSGKTQRQMLVVDESSFISSADMNKLMRIAESLDARVVKMGDYRQLGAVDAGAPFEQMLNRNIEHGNMTDIIRQRNESLKTAVYDAISGRIGKSMAGVNVKTNALCTDTYAKMDDAKQSNKPFDYVGARQDMRESLAKQAVDEYRNLSTEKRENTLLVVPSNELREAVNVGVREFLKEEGVVSLDGVKVSTFKGAGLTNAAMRYAHNYEIGNVLRFNTPSEHHGIARNTYFTVSENRAMVDGERYLILTGTDDPDKRIMIHPKEISSRGERAVEVFKETVRELAVGDEIRWVRNDKPRGIINSQNAEVIGVDKSSGAITFKMEDGSEKQLDMADPKNRHLDYSHAITTHAAQGATVDNVITVAESWHKLLTTQRSFYVQISRARDDVTLITDNPVKLEQQIQKEPGHIVKALDLYEISDKPLDHDLIVEVQQSLDNGTDMREVYLDLIVACEGDVYQAQQHLQQIGVDVADIEKGIDLEHAIDDAHSRISGEKSSSLTGTQSHSMTEGDFPFLGDSSERLHAICQQFADGDLRLADAKDMLSDLGIGEKDATMLLSSFNEWDELSVDNINNDRVMDDSLNDEHSHDIGDSDTLHDHDHDQKLNDFDLDI